MDAHQGIQRSVMSAIVTRVDGSQEERVFAFTSLDPDEHQRVTAALARGEHFTEEQLIPHGAMTPLED